MSKDAEHVNNSNKSPTKPALMPPEGAKSTQPFASCSMRCGKSQWGVKLEAIEGLMKTLLSQAQDKPLSAFVQDVGPGYRSENNTELLGRPLKSFSSGAELICFGCGESGHFQNNCE